MIIHSNLTNKLKMYLTLLLLLLICTCTSGIQLKRKVVNRRVGVNYNLHGITRDEYGLPWQAGGIWVGEPVNRNKNKNEDKSIDLKRLVNEFLNS